jgi:hypothetical protein
MQFESKTLEELNDMPKPIHGAFKVIDSDYHAFKAINSTSLKAASISMANFKDVYFPDELAPPKGRPDHFAFGTAFHAMMLDPPEFKRSFVSKPDVDFRTKAGKEWKAANRGKHILNPWDEYSLAKMRANLEASRYWKEFTTGPYETELAVFWADEMTGLQCKAKFDLINWDRGVLDLKTIAKNATERNIGYAIRDYGYSLQGSHYTTGLRAVFPDACDVFAFGFCEKNPPFTTRDCVLGLEYRRGSQTHYEALMQDVSYAIENNYYPSIGDNQTYILELK